MSFFDVLHIPNAMECDEFGNFSYNMAHRETLHHAVKTLVYKMVFLTKTLKTFIDDASFVTLILGKLVDRT